MSATLIHIETDQEEVFIDPSQIIFAHFKPDLTDDDPITIIIKLADSDEAQEFTGVIALKLWQILKTLSMQHFAYPMGGREDEAE